MKNAEFVALLSANTNKTKNLRTYSGCWISGAARAPDRITTKIGCVVALLQAKISEICNPVSQGLLVYNFQPIMFHNSVLYCTMDALIRPLAEIDDTAVKIGIPVQIIINCTTCEVCNATKGMLDMGLVTPEEVPDADPAKTFGNFAEYPAVCGFAAFSCLQSLDYQPMFLGTLDRKHFVRTCTAHTSFVEARQALAAEGSPFQYIGELIRPKEDLPKMLQRGIGNYIIKLMNPQGQEISLSPVKETLNREVRAEEEIKLYNEATSEGFTCEIEDTNNLERSPLDFP